MTRNLKNKIKSRTLKQSAVFLNANIGVIIKLNLERILRTSTYKTKDLENGNYTLIIGLYIC